MQAIAPRKDLYDAIQTVGRAVSGRSTLPILSHIKVTPIGGTSLRLTATDLEMWVECSLHARIQASLGDMEETNDGFTVPAKYFTEIVGALSEGDVILDRPDGGNKTQLRCGRSDYSLLGLPAEEFPALPEVEPTASLTVTGGALKAMIKQVAFAVSTDETRVILTGVLLIFDDKKLKMVATDTHRLAVRGGVATSGEGKGQAVLPARALNEISRLAGDDDEVVIAIAQGQARFEVHKKNTNGDVVATTTLVTRLIEGQFPNYERVIPQTHERKLTLETAEFIKAVKRVAIVARENANRIVLETEGAQLSLSAEAGTVGSARDEIEVAREGDDIQIAFNAKYLGDVLNSIETEGVVLELSEALRPGILKPIGDGAADYLCVLMPMQVI